MLFTYFPQMIILIKIRCVLWKESLNSDCQQFRFWPTSTKRTNTSDIYSLNAKKGTTTYEFVLSWPRYVILMGITSNKIIAKRTNINK